MTAITELLACAKNAIERGENYKREAAEALAAAHAQGANQREIALGIGKSVGWVNRLLKWRESGYRDATAFGSQAKASRQRAQRIHSTEQEPATSSEQTQAAAARARAETAKAEAAKARADAQRAKAEAAKAKADAQAARARENVETYSFCREVPSARWHNMTSINLRVIAW